mmetsp:Transcript_79187/g.164326  ORF Transcript_79187/g.164326 Transcript_79187/m.164326 type:complete len:546 (+) Transcript_79187:232-1869(+)
MGLDEELVPVLVGVGRRTFRLKDANSGKAPSPLEMMVEAVSEAARDSGAADIPKLLAEADCYATVNVGPIGVPKGFGGDGSFLKVYPNPPLALAQKLRAKPKKLFSSLASGHMPQLTVDAVAELIAAGECRSSVIAGAEFMDLLKKVHPEDIQKWTVPASTKPDKPGDPIHHKLYTKVPEQEKQHGMTLPVNVYPLFEQALRHDRHKALNEHMGEVSQLWAGFSEVAAKHPEHSWFPTTRSCDEIQQPNSSSGNRYVGYPYTKYHCSVLDVNQSAAILMMSVAEAKRRKIPQDRWVFLHGCAESIEKETMHRPALGRSPALHAAGRQALKDANVPISQISQFDLYSCFPVAVEVAAIELGIDVVTAQDASKLTVLGGLPFHGGPGANYAMHSIAAMVEHLRADPGSFGLVTANGGFMSKQAVGVYSTTPYSVTHPNARRWHRTSFRELQAGLDRVPDHKIAERPHGTGVVEAYTIVHGRKGPVEAICVGQLTEQDIGSRFAATSRDPCQIKAMMMQDFVGANVLVQHDRQTGCNSFFLNSTPSRL